jgi:hypothetical protein
MAFWIAMLSHNDPACRSEEEEWWVSNNEPWIVERMDFSQFRS